MLIIPSLDEIAGFWVSSFQFEPIDEATKILMKERVVPFNDVTMLQKKILKHTLSSENLSFIEGKCLLITNFIFISTKIYFLSNVFFCSFQRYQKSKRK
jgi:hypothetical protein